MAPSKMENSGKKLQTHCGREKEIAKVHLSYDLLVLNPIEGKGRFFFSILLHFESVVERNEWGKIKVGLKFQFSFFPLRYFD